MYKINLICVGNLKEKSFLDLCNEYIKRISKFAQITICELKEKNQYENIDLIISSESEEIIQKCETKKYVLFDVGGEIISSENFAKYIQNYFLTNSELNFVIGGSYGVSEKIKINSSKNLSISKMTFPHRLARVIVLEQIYRAFTIINNTSYHK